MPAPTSVEIAINLENAAFADEPWAEVARILRVIAKSAERVGKHWLCDNRPIIDLNGNNVGYLRTH